MKNLKNEEFEDEECGLHCLIQTIVIRILYFNER